MPYFKLGKKWLIIIIALAFILRIYRVGQPVFKEDENTTVSAAAYLYYCQLDIQNCHHQPNNFQQRLIALLSDNETEPNLAAEIYFWDWINDRPTNIHYARAWPHLYLLAFTYRFLGISQLSSRLIPVISGCLLALVGFFLARLFNLSLSSSLVYSLALAFSPHLIIFSRHSRMYSLFSLIFMFTIFWLSKSIKTKKIYYLFTTMIFFALAYFLHLLSLILPISLLFFCIYQSVKTKQPFYYRFSAVLLFLFIIPFYLKYQFNFDFFHTYLIAFQDQPHWQYLSFIFGSKFLSVVGWLIIIVNGKKILSKPLTAFLFILLITHLIFLIFFSQFPPGSAYVIYLLPLAYLLVFCSINHQSITIFVFSLVFVNLVSSVKFLYLYPFDRPQLIPAYKVIYSRIQPQDHLIGYLPRSYYLQGLPQPLTVTQLPSDRIYTLENLLIDMEKTDGNIFVVFEIEKQARFQPQLINYLNQYFTKLAGQGIDDYQVEIYYLGK